jgi:hypothetical protein
MLASSSCRYTGTWDTIVRISREEGLGGFFKGMESKILQTALNAVSGEARVRIGGGGSGGGGGVLKSVESEIPQTALSGRGGGTEVVLCFRGSLPTSADHCVNTIVVERRVVRCIAAKYSLLTCVVLCRH